MSDLPVSDELTIEERTRYGRWWSWRREGATTDGIVARELECGNHYSMEEVQTGLQRYASWCNHSVNRIHHLEERLQVAYGIKAHLSAQITKALERDKANPDHGLPEYEHKITISEKRGTTRERKIRYRNVNDEINSLIKLLLETEKHIATLLGLTKGDEGSLRPDLIEFDLGSFFDVTYETPDEAPELEVDTKPLPLPGEGSALDKFTEAGDGQSHGESTPPA